MSLVTILEQLIPMPHIHQGANNSFSLAIGLWAFNAGEFLPDTELGAGRYKFMVNCAFILLAIVRIGIFNCIWTSISNLLKEQR